MTKIVEIRNIKKEWLIFLSLMICSLFFFFGGVPLAGIIWGIGALITLPSERYRKWVSNTSIELKRYGTYSLMAGVLIVSILVIIWIVAQIFGSIAGLGKYEGENAEYWFNAYDEENGRVIELEEQIDDYQAALQETNDNIDEANDMISNVQNAEDIYELRDAIDSLNSVNTVTDPE